MKLAEALQERADLNREIGQLENRLNLNAVRQEGQKSPEDPAELMERLEIATDRLAELTAAINLRNSALSWEGETLTQMLARRDGLSQRLRILREFANRASELTHRGLRTEIAMESTVNVRELRKELDRLSARLRKLDNQIQSINWTTEL